jgi:hypothetical protein
MRKNSVQCDACCKSHPVEDEYDVGNLPQGWYTVVPGQGGGFKETLHFCSTKCLADWAEKQTIAVANVDILPNQLVFQKEVKIVRAEVIDNSSHMKCGEFEVTKEDREYWRDL